MKKKIRNKKGYIASFCIPLLLFIGIAFALGFILKKNNNTVLVSDMNAQYKALFMDIRTHGFSLYSFNKGLGSSMLGTYAYYLASPFNFIIFLFSKANLSYALLLIIGLKMSLCGLTMYTFLKHHFKKNKMLLLFSTSYAFMAFNVNYFFNIMWLDSVYLLPLVLLGIDKIVKNKKPYLYIITLFLTVFTNYYLAFMVCIFSVMYFIYRMYLTYSYKLEKEKIYRILKTFIVSSLIGGLLASFLLVPALLEFKDMPRGDYNAFAENPLSFNGNPFEIIGKMFMGSQNNETILSKEVFQIYAGIFIFLFVFLYFLNYKISKKEKRASFFILSIFILSMLINYFNYMWHGFNIPICFNGRYIFIFSCFMIYLAAASFNKIQYITKTQYFIVAPIFPILGTITFIGQFSFTNSILVFVSVCLSFMYLIFMYYYVKEEKRQRMILVLFSLLGIGELFSNMFFSLQDYEFKYVNEVQGTYQLMSQQLSTIKEKEKSLFYRFEKNFNYSANDSLYFDYNGIGTFLSTSIQSNLQFLSNLGYNAHNNIIEYLTTLPVADSILGMKYYMEKDTKVNFYKEMDKFEISGAGGIYYDIFKSDVRVYENPYALSIGTLVEKDVSKCILTYQNYDRLDYQNQIIHCLTGENKDIYEKIKLEKKEGTKFTFINTKNDDMIVFPNVKTELIQDKDQVELWINGIFLGAYTNSFFTMQFFENHADKGVTMEVETKNNSLNREQYIPYVYYFNLDEFQKTFKNLQQNSLEITKRENAYMEGTVHVTKENHYLFTTIPYNKGWTIRVDGKKIKYDKVFDNLIGFDLEEGTHKITFSFFPPGLCAGLCISTITLLCFGLYIYQLEKKEIRKM